MHTSPIAATVPAWALAAGVSVILAGVIFVLVWRHRQRGKRQGFEASLLTSARPNAGWDEAVIAGLPKMLSQPRFDEALDQDIARCDRGERELSLLLVSIDNLQELNEASGEQAGPRAIVATAQLLHDLAGPLGRMTRLSGDSFLISTDANLQATLVLATMARQRLAAAADPSCGGLGPSCSIGIANYPSHGPCSRLMGHASAAMRQVRLAGGGHHAVFDPVMAVDMRAQSELLRDLRHAVARNELELVYQPKFDASTQQITAAEALLRWHHPQRGLISPATFIPLAERFGLIGAIGNWVIDDACRQAGLWRRSGLRMRVAINISAYQMRQHDLVDRLLAALERHGLSAHRFTCEITESIAMEDTQVTQNSLKRMREAGLHISIDDFGVGQTSLSYLRRLPAAELKIDASFVQDLGQSVEAEHIVSAVIKLAHALKLRVVAEGVETERQCQWLVKMGCDELQGFLLARPMSAKALTLWAADDDPAMPGFRNSLFCDTQAADLDESLARDKTPELALP